MTYRIVTRDWQGGRTAATVLSFGDAELEASDVAVNLLLEPEMVEQTTHWRSDDCTGWLYTQPGGYWWSIRIYPEEVAS